MHKVIFRINKYGNKLIDRDITIISLDLDLEYTSKNEIKIPEIGTDFILGNEEFLIKNKIDSIQKNGDDDVCYVKIVFLELKRLKPKPKGGTYKDYILEYPNTYPNTRYNPTMVSNKPDNFFDDL